MSGRTSKSNIFGRVRSRHDDEDYIGVNYDSGANDNDSDNASQSDQDRDGKTPDKGRKTPHLNNKSAHTKRGEDRGRYKHVNDEEERHVYSFVPGEGIDVVVFAAYLKRWIDGTATIQPSRHPTDSSRLGYTVGAASALNREALEDLLVDTRQWQREQQSREFRRSPYDYSESDTFADRKRKGPTIAKKAPTVARPRERPELRTTQYDGQERNRHQATEQESERNGRHSDNSERPRNIDRLQSEMTALEVDDRRPPQPATNTGRHSVYEKGQQIKYTVVKEPTKKGRHDGY